MFLWLKEYIINYYSKWVGDLNVLYGSITIEKGQQLSQTADLSCWSCIFLLLSGGRGFSGY